ncbi:MAG: class I SAM-dependent methyltransferase [Flavobacteriales bacterium]
MTNKYYHNKESVQEYINAAKDHNGAELIKVLRQFLSEDSRVLEIGSGPGSDWKILNRYFNAVGSDNSKEFLNHLLDYYPSGRFLELDAITLEVDELFDALYSNKVMHHLSDDDLQNSIRRQCEILNPNGIVCHSFWKGEGSELFKGLYVNYHNEKEIEQAFEWGFDVLLIESYTEFEADDSVLFIGKKKHQIVGT